jgi:hypothetical protein
MLWRRAALKVAERPGSRLGTGSLVGLIGWIYYTAKAQQAQPSVPQ